MTRNMILTDEGFSQFKTVIEMLNKSLHELVKIAEDMVPERLIQNGLKVYLTELCKIWEEEEHVEIILTFSEGFKSTNELLDTQVYRIVKALVQKAFRDQFVTMIYVSLRQERNLFIVRVIENGSSFRNVEVIDDVINIKSMAESMGGTFMTDFSVKGENTVHIEFECNS